MVLGLIAGIVLIPGLFFSSLMGLFFDVISEENDVLSFITTANILAIILSILGAIVSNFKGIVAGVIFIFAALLTFFALVAVIFLSVFHWISFILLVIALALSFKNG